MTDHALRRADELLTELVELVETARTVPISGSCIVPREHTLDLLDDLRDVLPPEMAQARVIVAEADGRLADAERRAAQLQARSEAEAQGRLDDAAATVREQVTAATEHAAQLVADARAEAARLVDAGEAENARLLSSAGVH
ncbi:MAG: DivIVA domain-containing protein, partial [Actinomycetota bacterium]|nr:DivIVA domain-containing protein [Actinomycetota bacterium]